MGNKIRSLFVAKPQAPPPPPVISLPCRIPVRRKREVSENDSSSLSRPMNRQRTDSDESTSSTDTIRPADVVRRSQVSSTPTLHAPPPASAVPPKSILKKSTASPAPPALHPGRSAPVKATLTRSTSYNHVAPGGVGATTPKIKSATRIRTKAPASPTKAVFPALPTKPQVTPRPPRTPSPTRPAVGATSHGRSGLGHKKSASEPLISSPPTSPTPAQLLALARSPRSPRPAPSRPISLPQFSIGDEDAESSTGAIILTREDEELISESRGFPAATRKCAQGSSLQIGGTIPRDQPVDRFNPNPFDKSTGNVSEMVTRLMSKIPPTPVLPARLYEAARQHVERLCRFEVAIVLVHGDVVTLWDGESK